MERKDIEHMRRICGQKCTIMGYMNAIRGRITTISVVYATTTRCVEVVVVVMEVVEVMVWRYYLRQAEAYEGL